MKHVASVRAALKAAAPVVAIPVEGRAPICIKARLLKGALKGVTIHSVTVLDNGSLKITGMAGANVRTSSTFVPMSRGDALIMIWDWTEKERRKRIKIINQGVLSAAEQRAMKLKQAEQAGIAELLQAHKDVEEIYRQAKEHVNPLLTYADDERRKDVMAEYSEFRRCRHLRKRGSVIRWRLAQLRKELETITVKRGGRRERKKTFAKSAKHVPRMILIQREIARLEAHYTTVVPEVWQEFRYHADGGYWRDSWIMKRPKEQTCGRNDYWRADYDAQSLRSLAVRLKDALANIRALTPPEDETEEMPVAA